MVITPPIAFFTVFVIAFAAGTASYYIVPQQEAYIIERLGKFSRVSSEGLHFRIPVIERIVSKVDLRIQQSPFIFTTKTKDNATIDVRITVQYYIDNAPVAERENGVYRYYYILSQPRQQMYAYVADMSRSLISNYTFDEAFGKKDIIAQDVLVSVAPQMERYGFILISTTITNINLSPEGERYWE